jgi:hypothetical protein
MTPLEEAINAIYCGRCSPQWKRTPIGCIAEHAMFFRCKQDHEMCWLPSRGHREGPNDGGHDWIMAVVNRAIYPHLCQQGDSPTKVDE